MKTLHRPSADPHPLQDVVMRAFAKSSAHDAVSLSVFLAGATNVRTKSGGSAMKAFQTVATDVLGYMEDSGLLELDAYGWYRLPAPR
jgi:hypothetical protein